MAQVQLWQLGRGQTAFTIVGQTVDANGLLADAAGAGSQTLLGMWDELDVENEPETEEISAADASRQHTVILKEAYRARFVQILRKAKATGEGANVRTNPVLYLVNNYDILKMTLTNGADTWTGYVVRGPHQAFYRKGKSTAILQGLACDAGSAFGYSTT